MTQPTVPFYDLSAAAALLELPMTSVRALVDSGYLGVASDCESGPQFHMSELKAFVARNADNGAGAGLLERALASAGGFETQPPDSVSVPELAPQELWDLLDERAEQMAWRVFKIFSTVFPEAGKWPVRKRGAFVRQAKGRFEAILAFTELGPSDDETLFEELRQIGASAAQAGTSLAHLLVLLRMSRDLMVQNAIELAEGDGRHGGFALSLLLTRILPAMDRLTDALSNGYWEAVSDGA